MRSCTPCFGLSSRLAARSVAVDPHTVRRSVVDPGGLVESRPQLHTELVTPRASIHGIPWEQGGDLKLAEFAPNPTPRGWTSCWAAISCTVRSRATPRAPTRFFVRLSEKRDHLSASWRSTINPAGGVPTLYVPRADVAEVQNELIRYETIETSAAAAENGRGPARARPRLVSDSWDGPRAPGAVRGARREMHAETIDTETIKVKFAADENGPPEPLIRAGPWDGKRDRGPDQRRRRPLSPAPAHRGDTRLAPAAGWLRPSVSVRPSTTGRTRLSHTDTATDESGRPSTGLSVHGFGSPGGLSKAASGAQGVAGNDYVAARSSRTSRV